MTLRAAIRSLLARRADGDRPDAWVLVQAPHRATWAAVPDGVLSDETLEWVATTTRIDETSIAQAELLATAESFDLVEFLAIGIEDS